MKGPLHIKDCDYFWEVPCAALGTGKKERKRENEEQWVPWDTLSKMSLQIQRQMRVLCLCVTCRDDTKSWKGKEKNWKHSEFVLGRATHEAALPQLIGNSGYSPRQYLLRKWQWLLHPGYLAFVLQPGNASLRWLVHSPPLPPNNAHNTFLYLYYLV